MDIKISGTDNFRKNLRRAMEARGLSQRTLAKRLGTSSSYVCRIMGGRIDPSVSRAIDLGLIVGFTLSDLLLPASQFRRRCPLR